MRVKLGWVLLGLGIAVVVGCGAGKESEKKGHVDLGEAGTTGTTGGDSSSGGGASGSDSGGPTNGGASGGDGGGPTNGGASGGDGGVPTNGGASGGDGGVPTNGGAFVAGAAGSQAAAAVPVGEPCTTDDTCGDSGICYVGPGGPFGSCRIACDWEATGERDACAADELCVTASGGVTAGCLRTCDPYAESSVCDAEDWCIPEPSASYTGGDPADGLCVTRGESTAGDGEPCVAGSCAAGLLCYLDGTGPVGTAHCEPPCDPNAESDDPGACPTGSDCREISQGGNVCLRLCDPYGEKTCPEGQWCFPFLGVGSDGSSVVEGQCVVAGAGQEDEECVRGDCGEDLVCTTPNLVFGGGLERCRPLCSPAAGDGCGDGDCAAVAGDFLDLGICEAGCVAFGNGADAGCGAEQWCAPTSQAEINTCVPAGSTTVGDGCRTSADCVARAYCDCRFGADTACFTEGRCETLCDPAAVSGDVGFCSDGVCVPERRGSTSLPYGVCRESCELGVSDCSDSEESCVPGEIIGAQQDACMDVPSGIAVGDSCGRPNVELAEPCGTTALCLVSEIDETMECVDVCRPSLGDFGTQDHPDCADPAATCVEVEAGVGYGRCR